MEIDSEAVRLTHDSGIARVTLAKPDRRNALSVEMADGIIAAFDRLAGTDTRCVVLAGEGPAFSAGGDVAAMVERAESEQTLDESVRHVIRNTGGCVRRVYESEFPTVALVDGPAFGAGATLAIACDLQVASEGAQIGFGFRNVGLAVDSGVSYLLPKLVGPNTAKELVFTGELMDASRGEELGLLNHVFPADEFEQRAEALIDRIADGPTVALRTSKRLLRANHQSMREAVEQEASAQAAVFDSADHAEGVAAFTESRDPEFTGE